MIQFQDESSFDLSFAISLLPGRHSSPRVARARPAPSTRCGGTGLRLAAMMTTLLLTVALAIRAEYSAETTAPSATLAPGGAYPRVNASVASSTTCVEPCPMSPGEAGRIMDHQARVSARLVARIPERRLKKLKNQHDFNLRRKGEFHDGYVASRILAWAVGAPRAAEGGDILEIGASTGAGSTSILARALKDEILEVRRQGQEAPHVRLGGGRAGPAVPHEPEGRRRPDAPRRLPGVVRDVSGLPGQQFFGQKSEPEPWCDRVPHDPGQHFFGQKSEPEPWCALGRRQDIGKGKV